jgi:glucosamine kinase
LAQIVRQILREILSSPISVVGDMEIALEAACGSGPGVIVIAGTGSIAYGRGHDGRIARAGGWGFAIGDEGSAHWIGRSAVNAILRAADLHDPDSDTRSNFVESPYIASIFKSWGVTSLGDLSRAANSIPPPDFAPLFPAIAKSNDALATRVLADAGRELAQIAAVIIRRLFAAPGTKVVPVAMIGGVFRYAPAVREVFYNELRSLDSQVEVAGDVVEPVEGALRMARRASAQSVVPGGTRL